MARARSPRGSGAALHDEILFAAADLLAETGSEDAVSVRAVADRVGVSVPAIYLHFAGKQELLDAVCDHVFESLDAALEQAGVGVSSPVERLRAFGTAYVKFAVAHPEHYRLVLMTNRGISSEPSPEVAASRQAGLERLVGGIAAAQAAGAMEPGDPMMIALVFWASVHGIASLLIARPTIPWPPLEVFVGLMMDRVGRGFGLDV